jgi:hypothetical protein
MDAGSHCRRFPFFLNVVVAVSEDGMPAPRSRPRFDKSRQCGRSDRESGVRRKRTGLGWGRADVLHNRLGHSIDLECVSINDTDRLGEWGEAARVLESSPRGEPAPAPPK